MICFEIKKIFSKTISRISLIVLLFSLVISCYFAITNITYIDNRGVSHTGIAAARNLRKEKQRWEGVLDKAALQAVIDEYRKVNEEYPIRQGDYTANLLHDSKVQGFSEIKDMINEGKDIEVNCHFCNTAYTFTPQELQELLKKCTK